MDIIVRNVRDEVTGRTFSDDEGRFWITAPDPGLYSIAVSGFGYDSTAAATVAVTRGQNLYVELRIEPMAIGLSGVTVTAPRVIPWIDASGFYDRERRGMGHFFGPREMDQFRGSQITQLLRRVPGVMVIRDQIMVRGGAGNFRTSSCTPKIVLDGMTLRLGPNETLADLVPLQWIDAMEVYKGPAAVPPQWRDHATCGVIALWLKH